jgi:hypothetical protein
MLIQTNHQDADHQGRRIHSIESGCGMQHNALNERSADSGHMSEVRLVQINTTAIFSIVS